MVITTQNVDLTGLYLITVLKTVHIFILHQYQLIYITLFIVYIELADSHIMVVDCVHIYAVIPMLSLSLSDRSPLAFITTTPSLLAAGK